MTEEAQRQGTSKKIQGGSFKSTSKTTHAHKLEMEGLIARKGSGGKQVRLHISVFENQVADTIHDIAYRRAVIDVTSYY